MDSDPPGHPSWPMAVAALAALAALVLDVLTPLRAAAGALYAPAVILAGLRGRRAADTVAIVATGLILVGYVAAPPARERAGVDVACRAVAAAGAWAAAAVVARRAAAMAADASGAWVRICDSCGKVRHPDGSWRPPEPGMVDRPGVRVVHSVCQGCSDSRESGAAR